jgi:hypothetical protein
MSSTPTQGQIIQFMQNETGAPGNLGTPSAPIAQIPVSGGQNAPLNQSTNLSGAAIDVASVGIGALIAGLAASIIGAPLALGIVAGGVGGYLWNQNPNESANQLFGGQPPTTQNSAGSFVLLAVLAGGIYMYVSNKRKK